MQTQSYHRLLPNTLAHGHFRWEKGSLQTPSSPPGAGEGLCHGRTHRRSRPSPEPTRRQRQALSTPHSDDTDLRSQPVPTDPHCFTWVGADHLQRVLPTPPGLRLGDTLFITGCSYRYRDPCAQLPAGRRGRNRELPGTQHQLGLRLLLWFCEVLRGPGDLQHPTSWAGPFESHGDFFFPVAVSGRRAQLGKVSLTLE